MKYLVIALTVSGLNKKIHRNGDQVTDSDFPPGRAKELVAKEFLKEIPEVEAPVDEEAKKKLAEEQEAKDKLEAEARLKAEADAANAAEVAKKKADFEAAIKDGDDALGAKNFELAIVAFNIALELDFDNDAANAKLEEVEKAKNAEVVNPDLKKEVVANPAILEELANDNKKSTTNRKK